jgi:hypothetical protein
LRTAACFFQGWAIGPRMVCTRCCIIDADARPNWREHRALGRGTTDQGRALRRRRDVVDQQRTRRERALFTATSCRA